MVCCWSRKGLSTLGALKNFKFLHFHSCVQTLFSNANLDSLLLVLLLSEPRFILRYLFSFLKKFFNFKGDITSLYIACKLFWLIFTQLPSSLISSVIRSNYSYSCYIVVPSAKSAQIFISSLVETFFLYSRYRFSPSYQTLY